MTVAGEMTALRAALDSQRAHVFAAIDGLSDAQLTQAVMPSGWSCAGLVKHLALSDEHYWFRSIVGGQPLEGFFPEEDGGDWIVADDETPASVVALYRNEIAAADKALDEVDATDSPAQRDPQWDECRVVSRTRPRPPRQHVLTRGVVVGTVRKWTSRQVLANTVSPTRT